MRRILVGTSALALAATALVIASGPPASAARRSPIMSSPTAPSPTVSGAVVAWGTTPSAPAGYRGSLSGVATAGPGEAWAVGADNPDSSVSQVLDQPYAEHWNGSAWTATPLSAPSLYSTHQGAELNGAAAVGPGEAWAVGDVSDLWSVASQTLAYHWTGGAWTRTTTPNPAGAASSNRLLGVAVRSSADVWAVGYSGYPQTSLVEHWNGTAWTTVTVPSIGALQAVAVDATHVWVAGVSGVERFDGTGWTALPAPPVTYGSLNLQGLAAASSGLWAVGTVTTPYFDGYISHSYAAVFANGTWTTVGLAGSGLTGVTASGSTVLAAAPNDGVFRLSTAGASREVTPTPGTVYPAAVAADSAGNAWAVGFTANRGGQAPAIINAPGIGQGGIIVTAGAANATVTWTGPANHSETADVSGRLAVAGLPVGTYTVISSYSGCNPGVATVTVTAGIATPVDAHVTC